MKRNEIIFFFLMMPNFWVYGSNPDTAKANQYLETARQLIDSMAIEEALDLTDQAINIYQSTPDGTTQLGYAYNVKGDVYLEKGDYETAFDYYSKAKDALIPHFGEIHPEVAQSYNKIGICFLAERAIAEAEAHFEKALAIRLQVFDETHSKIADSYNNLGNCAIEQNDIQAAYKYYQQTLNIRLQLFGRLNADVAASYNNLGYCYLEVREYPKAISLFLESLKIREQVLGQFHIKIAQNCQSLANAYIQTNQPELADSYLKKALTIYNQNNQNNHPDVADIYNSLGFVNYSIGEFGQVKDYYESAKTILSAHFKPNSIRFWTLYNNYGDFYLEQGDYNKALLYYQNNLQILQDNLPENHPNFGHVYNSKGTAFAKMRAYPKALEQYEKALQIFTGNQYTYYQGITYNKMGNVYLEDKNAKAAIPAYQQSLAKFQATDDIAVKTITSLLTNLGSCFVDEKNYKKARQYYLQSIALIEKNYHKKHPELAENYINLGVLYEMEGNLEMALSYLKQAQQILKIDLEKEISQFVASPSPLLRLLNNKAAILRSLYDKNKQQALLIESLNHYSYAISIIESLKKQYQEETSQQILGQLAYRSFNGAIENCYALFQLTKSSNYLEKGFKFSEQSRSSILLEVLNANRAMQFANIPDSLIAQEQSLKNKIIYFEKKRQELVETDTQNYALLFDRYSNEIFSLKSKHEQLIQQFEIEYPAYHNLKYNNEIITIEQVQQHLLVDSTALVEYFVSDSTIYIFAINKRAADFKAIPFKDLLETMKMLRAGLYLPLSDSEQKHKFSSKIYQYTGYYLYQKLIEPVENKLPPKVILINGGLLNFIPFEALLSELPSPSHRLKSYQYLLKKYEFSYAYSATLLQEVQSRQASKNNGQLLSFAPRFLENDYRNLAPLKHNITEVQQIQPYLKGKTFIDTKATVQNFLKQANQFHIIHLATHAKANIESGDFSFLAFSANEHKEDLLYAKDVYNLSLNADMVVLSACETAQGTLLKGEGMVSLGNAFFYAGAKSIISTLWSIDDYSTKELLSLFYKNLKAGQSKREALRLAKLHFLKNSSNPHPYYWAAFVANGDMKPILKPSYNYFIWGLLLAGLIISLLGFWMLKNEKGL